MGQILIFLIVLWLGAWATVEVRRRGPSSSGIRTLLYVVIWVLPFIGPAIAGYVVFRRVQAHSASSDHELFDAVVEKRREISNS